MEISITSALKLYENECFKVVRFSGKLSFVQLWPFVVKTFMLVVYIFGS